MLEAVNVGKFALEATNLSKSFDGKPVVADFSAAFPEGSRTCLMGPSGCGKTTLMNLLMGLIRPDSGEIWRQEGLRISAVFQENRLLEPLTAEANVAFVNPPDRSAIRPLLLELGIPEDSLAQPVSTFSGGMKRRVALCRALLADSHMLFLDEPYKGLDEDTRAKVMRIVKERTQKKTVVLITHDRQEAEGFSVIELG